MVIVSFKSRIPKNRVNSNDSAENHNAFRLASESNQQNPRDRSLDLPFYFHYNTTFLKPSVA